MHGKKLESSTSSFYMYQIQIILRVIKSFYILWNFVPISETELILLFT